MASACSTSLLPRAIPFINRRAKNTCMAKSGSSAVAQSGSTISQRGYDLVLSSGFLAFAAHSGFLQAVDEIELPVNAVMGTSAGALVGSLYCAGYTPREIAREFSAMAPIDRLSLSAQPWDGGLLSLDQVVAGLRELIPATFEELQRDFGVGVVSFAGQHMLLDRGALPEAVAASAAIPLVFSKVAVPGTVGGPFIDGGMRCRIGLDLWRQQRYGSSSSSSDVGSTPSSTAAAANACPPAVVHLIQRSSPFSGSDSTAKLASRNAVVVRSPKSGKSFWDFEKDVFERQFTASRDRALPALEALLKSGEKSIPQAAAGQQQQQQQPSSAAIASSRRRAATPAHGVGNAVPRSALVVAAKALPPTVSERGQ